MLPNGFREHTNSRGKSTKSLDADPKHTGVHTGRYCSLPAGFGSRTGTCARSLATPVSVWKASVDGQWWSGNVPDIR